MRISRPDPDNENPNKRRHFEISIDSPISILSCRATQANLSLPEYSNSNANAPGQQPLCGCPNATMPNFSPSSSTSDVPTIGGLNSRSENAIPNLPPPPRAHLSTNAASGVQRPIHMLRNPSYNPPAFDADDPPPPIATPPPNYDVIIGTPSHDPWEDYFAR